MITNPRHRDHFRNIHGWLSRFGKYAGGGSWCMYVPRRRRAVNKEDCYVKKVNSHVKLLFGRKWLWTNLYQIWKVLKMRLLFHEHNSVKLCKLLNILLSFHEQKVLGISKVFGFRFHFTNKHISVWSSSFSLCVESKQRCCSFIPQTQIHQFCKIYWFLFMN